MSLAAWTILMFADDIVIAAIALKARHAKKKRTSTRHGSRPPLHVLRAGSEQNTTTYARFAPAATRVAATT